MDRIREFDLYNTLMNHDGIAMGYSAGAVIQLAEYHLSPDEDYSEFQYYNEIPYLKDFYVEVADIQKDAVKRVIAERVKARSKGEGSHLFGSRGIAGINDFLNNLC